MGGCSLLVSQCLYKWQLWHICMECHLNPKTYNDKINYTPLILTAYLIKETASWGNTKWLTFNLQFLQPILYAWTQLSNILLYPFPFYVKPSYKSNPNPLQHCQDRLVPRLQYHCIKRLTQIIY